jgi:hypothetical protein
MGLGASVVASKMAALGLYTVPTASAASDAVAGLARLNMLLVLSVGRCRVVREPEKGLEGPR